MSTTHRTALRWFAFAILIALCACWLSGCGSGGHSSAREDSIEVDPEATASARIQQPDGTSFEVPPGARWSSVQAHAQQPSRPEGVATATVSRSESAASAAAETPGADHPSAVLAGMWWVTALGILLVIAGAILFAARRSGYANPVAHRVLAAIPPWSGRIMVGFGGLLIVTPFYLEQYGGVLLVVALVAVALVGVWWWLRTRKPTPATGGARVAEIHG